MNNTNNSKLTGNAKELRKNMTKEERHLWYDFLKSLPITVNRQKVIGNYELPHFVQTVQKRNYGSLNIKFKQHTDIAFHVVSVLFLVVFSHCCRNVCIHL